MKKAILILCMLVLTLIGYSQQCVFEKTYDNGFDFLAMRSSPIEMVALADGWMIVGYKFSCSGAYAMFVNCEGEMVWEHFADAGYSTYTDLQKIDTLIYASGVDLQGDDYPSPEQNGFIDVFSPSGFQQRLLTDTTFNGGFGSIFVDSTRIVTIASKNDFAGIGYSPTLKMPFNYINVYDRISQFSTPSLSFQMNGLKDAFLVDSVIVVQTFNGFFSFDFSGQLLGNSFFTNNDSFALLKPFQDTLITVGSNSTFSITNVNFQTSVYKLLHTVMDSIIDYGLHNNEWIFLAKKGPSYLIARYDDNVDFIDSFHINIGCAIPTDIAFNDSVVAVTGYEQIGENFRIFVKTFDYNGTGQKATGALTFSTSTLVVDSVIYDYTININPNQPIVLYDGWLTATVVIKNNSIDTVHSFCLYSDKIDYMNCYFAYLQRCYNNIALAPADSIIVTWSYYQYLQSNRTIANNFWLVGINEGLMNDCSSYAYAETFFVDVEEINAANVIKVFPNPFENQISVTDLPIGASIGIYNLQGKQLIQAKGESQTILDLNHLPLGMYLYSIANNEGQVIKTGKLVKQ